MATSATTTPNPKINVKDMMKIQILSVIVILSMSITQFHPVSLHPGIHSDSLKRTVREGRVFDPDRITGLYLTGGCHNSHDAGFADEVAVRVAIQDSVHQAWLELV
ncbi:hypothetical protein [Brevibacillus panacihumi]|uniref:hypothetical protein n=2 Tax=Brevibacillus panacihumi TaxID=497735 RepID=UPI0020966A25|nr:hypothetical protein [Brevibacillus panacihumi]